MEKPFNLSLVLCILLATYVDLASSSQAKEWLSRHFSLTSPGEKLRQDIVKAKDGKDNVPCKAITNKRCPRDNITFWLYTKARQDKPHQLNPANEDTIRNAPFVKQQPVKILIHGYTMNRDKAINEVLRPAYFKSYDFNVISVDWSAICPKHCYVEASLSIPTVGYCVARFVEQLQRLRSDLGEVHILGHSLGAHVTAWASQYLNLRRVTQFDPALPLFSNEDKRLFRKPKGVYADVWHTNCGLNGRQDPSGTVDVYFNHMRDQPGCKCDSGCAHLRAVQYYAETVSSKTPLKAFPCVRYSAYTAGKCRMPTMGTLANFGENPTTSAKGSYLAFTNPNSPFIIKGDVYTREDSFRGLKNMNKIKCEHNDFIENIGQLLL